jgi:hypothetical protein
MEKIQIDNEKYIIYSPDSLKYITDSMMSILNESIFLYQSLFDVNQFRKFRINYFDNIDQFREFIYSLRGEETSLPEYAVGTFDNGMINAFIQPNIIVGTPLYNKKRFMASHELFHIMYKELILEKESKKRVVWFDEGMAQLFSGEYKELLDDNYFENWLNNLIETTRKIPNLNELRHGTNFENDKYSGYKLSLLAVKYLFDTLSFNEFKKLMHDTDKIQSYGNEIIRDAMNWYKESKSRNTKRK